MNKKTKPLVIMEILAIDDRVKNKKGYWEKMKNMHYCPICENSYTKKESAESCKLHCEKIIKIYMENENMTREEAILKFKMESL